MNNSNSFILSIMGLTTTSAFCYSNLYCTPSYITLIGQNRGGSSRGINDIGAWSCPKTFATGIHRFIQTPPVSQELLDNCSYDFVASNDAMFQYFEIKERAKNSLGFLPLALIYKKCINQSLISAWILDVKICLRSEKQIISHYMCSLLNIIKAFEYLTKDRFKIRVYFKYHYS